MADSKQNPLVSGDGGSSSGGGIDFVKDADQLHKSQKGFDCVDQQAKMSTTSVKERANPDSIPDGGELANVALKSDLAPGNGGSAGPAGKKPFKLK